MNYVKSCLIITMLLGAGYSQCNESNWEEYYNSEGHNMVGCDLVFANLSFANLTDAYCRGAFFVWANLENTNFDGASLTYAYFDENQDTYDDVSYDVGATSGDLNIDGGNDVLDVVMLIDIIINP